MKLWLDDLRPVPYGYEGAKSVNEAKKLIQEAEHNGIEIEALDLDHDLGRLCGSGRRCHPAAGLAGRTWDLLSGGDPYGQPGGESQHGEDSGQILGRTVLVGNFVII